MDLMKLIQTGKRICLFLCCLSVVTVVFSSVHHRPMEPKEDLARLREQFPQVCGEVEGLDWKDTDRMVKLIYSHETEMLDKKEVILFSKYVHGWAFAALSNQTEGKHFNKYMDAILENGVISRFPKLVYSDYGMVREIPFHLLAALPACNTEQKVRLIAAVKKIVEFDRLYQDVATVRENVNTDYMYNVLPHLFMCALYQPDEQAAIRDMQAFSFYLSACTQYTDGEADGLKPDGTGFHHGTHYNGYMYAYKTWVEYMYRLKGTSFRITPEAYRRMKHAVVSEYLMATLPMSGEEHYFANSLAGRHPFAGLAVSFGSELFRQLVEIGGDVEGKEIDEELASYYNAFFRTNCYRGIKPHELDGFYQFNYSPAGIYRCGDWVATMRCPTVRFWGGEIYSGTNRFGRYQSHGSLEIMYNGSLKRSGYPDGWERFSGKRGGWDWNVVPGTTTVHYTDWNEMNPNRNNADRFDQRAKSTSFAGALSWGDCGMFAASFDQGDHWGGRRFEPTNLSFSKSVFAFDGIMLSIGSGIRSYGNYPDEFITATNLFQSVEYQENEAPVLDRQKMKKGTHKELNDGKAHWLITPSGTGYLIPEGNDPLVFAYDDQRTPGPEGISDTSWGILCASKAYINHGSKPTGGRYCFYVIPSVTTQTMSTRIRQILDTKKPLFRVRQHQDSLHIVEHVPSRTLAYALFAPANALQEGMLRSADTPLLVMERQEAKDGKLELAVCSPDLRPQFLENGKSGWISNPTVSTLVLQGHWKLAGAHSEAVVSCSRAEGDTQLVLTLKDGFPLYLTLTKDE